MRRNVPVADERDVSRGTVRRWREQIPGFSWPDRTAFVEDRPEGNGAGRGLRG